MTSNILCLERYQRILSILDRLGGAASFRDLKRTYGIYTYEIEQTEQYGETLIEVYQPRTGRPSRRISKLNKILPAKLPPLRCEIEPSISSRHRRFAFNYCLGELGAGFSFRRRAYFAYQQTYGKNLSVESASAAASRLLRRGDVRAAIQWTYAYYNPEIPKSEGFPRTESQIWQRLYELGNFRAKWAPWWINFQK